MVFDDESRTMTFPLTSTRINFWRGRRFLTKDEIMQAIDEWKFNRNHDIIIMNLLCNEWGPAWCQYMVCNHLDIDDIISDLAEISLSHGIIYIGNTGTTTNLYNCICVAETPNHQTNIDADVIDAIVKKIGGSGK